MIRPKIATFFFLLAIGLPLLAQGEDLVVEGLHVVPHMQSTEMKYRREADFSLGARVELFLRSASTETMTIPATADIRLRGQTPDDLLKADQWAWHDLPSAWEGEPLRLPPGTMTVWSWNGKREDWGLNSQADLSIAIGDAKTSQHALRIEAPKVWLSAVTFLASGSKVQPDSMIFHVVNQSDLSLNIKGCRLWLPEANSSWRVLRAQPWNQDVNCFPTGGMIPAGDRGGAVVVTGPLPLTYAAVEVQLVDSNGELHHVWSHQRIKREVFDISGGWVHDTSGGGVRPLESESIHKTLRRMHVNTAHIGEMPGYTDQTGPDGLYTRYPLKYFGGLQPPEHYDTDALLPRVHAVETLGEPQYGGGRPVPPQECWKALSVYAPTRLPTSVTHSEERLWRFYAGISDYPHYDAYRVTAPSADAWFKYERWGDKRVRWGAPLETIGEMSRSLRELNRPRPTAYWSQGPHFDWEGYGRNRGSPTPDELRQQAYHALSSRITSLYWFNLSLRSLVTFPDLIEPMTRVGREIRMLENYYLEGDATSHQRVLRDGKPDWDLDVVAGPRGGLLFALDLAYEPDPDERVFKFGPPRQSTFRFPLPCYLREAVDLFRVDADGITPVDYRINGENVEIHDTVSRVAIYVVANSPNERQRIDSLRQQLLADEKATEFDPANVESDLEVLELLLKPKSGE